MLFLSRSISLFFLSSELHSFSVVLTVKYLLTNSKCIENTQLKVGAFVMVTVNLNLEKGICNGSQGIIIAINEINETPIPTVKFYNGIIMDISYYSWQSENYPLRVTSFKKDHLSVT